MPKLSRALTLPVLLIALAGCGSDEDPASTASDATATATATATAAAGDTGGAAEGGCEKVEAPEPKGDGKLSKPKLKLDASKTYTATVRTNCGAFTITLDAKNSPITGGSFVTLARKGFYDGTTFHRVVPDFVIQGGDPKGDGTGGPGYSVVEAPPAKTSYKRGLVAMAKTGIEEAGTSGSQFFVDTADVTLDPDYAVLGKVTKGMETVDRIAALGTGDGPPSETVVIEKVTVSTK